MLSSLSMAESAQGFDDRVLRLRLTGIDDIVDFSDVAEARMIFLAVHRGNPAVVTVWVAVELAVAEVATQEPELPHVVSDVFPHIADGPVGANDDLLIFLRDFVFLCVPCVLCG